MVYLVPLRGAEFSFKAIKEFVDDLALAVIEGRCAVLVPKGGLADDIVCFAQGFRNGFPKSLSVKSSFRSVGWHQASPAEKNDNILRKFAENKIGSNIN